MGAAGQGGLDVNITHLPQALFDSAADAAAPLLFYDYAAAGRAYREKSVLHKNVISLMVQGRKTLHFAQQVIEIQADEGHFFAAGNCLTSIDLSQQGLFRSLLIFFDNEVLLDFYVKYDAVIRQVQASQKAWSGSYVTFKKDAFLGHYITSLTLLLQQRPCLSAEMRLLKFEELLLYLLEKVPAAVLSFQPTAHQDFADLEIRKAVEANVTNNVTIKELAFLCHMSVSTFKRRFAHLYGTSPSKWFWQQRMALAATLLQEHQERPSDVYYKVGYATHASFSHSFKKAFGVTPKQFQQQQLSHQP